MRITFWGRLGLSYHTPKLISIPSHKCDLALYSHGQPNGNTSFQWKFKNGIGNGSVRWGTILAYNREIILIRQLVIPECLIYPFSKHLFFFWDITMDKILSWLPRMQQWEKQTKIPGLQYLTKPCNTYDWLHEIYLFGYIFHFVFLSPLNLKIYEGRKLFDVLRPIFSVPTFMPCIEWTLKIYRHWVKE